MENHSLSEYTMRQQDFRAATARVSPRNDILPLSYVVESSRKASGNDPLTAVLPCKKSDATRERLVFSIPEGILLTTHDHALLTKNFRALALEYKSKSHP